MKVTVGVTEVTGINFTLQRQPMTDVTGTISGAPPWRSMTRSSCCLSHRPTAAVRRTRDALRSRATARSPLLMFRLVSTC
jgi:hypothetical protein